MTPTYVSRKAPVDQRSIKVGDTVRDYYQTWPESRPGLPNIENNYVEGVVERVEGDSPTKIWCKWYYPNGKPLRGREDPLWADSTYLTIVDPVTPKAPDSPLIALTTERWVV